MRRLPLQNSAGETLSDAHVAIEIQLVDGRSDLIIASDAENPLKLTSAREDGWLIQTDWDVQLNGEMAWLRRDKRGNFECATVCRANAIKVNKAHIILEAGTDLAEFKFKGERMIRIE